MNAYHAEGFRRTFAVVVLSAVASAAQGQPGLIAYDGFSNGPLANLAGSNGGSGWTSPWNGSGTTLVTSIVVPGLAFPGLATGAGAAYTEPQAFYADTTSYFRMLPAITGNHFYMSFLLRPGSQYTTLGAGIRWGAYPNWIMCGAPDGSNYGFHIGRYIYEYSNAPVNPNQTALIVVHMESGPAQTTYRMYINHPVGQPQPAFPDAQYARAGASPLPATLEIFNDGDFTTDEIRVGTTWESVLPACYANCDQSSATPALTANDFACFLNSFAAGEPYANCDGVGGLTANDFSCFLNAYAAGCP
jgi:hypothetical protein